MHNTPNEHRPSLSDPALLAQSNATTAALAQWLSPQARYSHTPALLAALLRVYVELARISRHHDCAAQLAQEAAEQLRPAPNAPGP